MILCYSLADLTAENERLNEEKDVLVESLLAQTEKLEREREERMKVLLFHNIHSDASKRIYRENGGVRKLSSVEIFNATIKCVFHFCAVTLMNPCRCR